MAHMEYSDYSYLSYKVKDAKSIPKDPHYTGVIVERLIQMISGNFVEEI